MQLLDSPPEQKILQKKLISDPSAEQGSSSGPTARILVVDDNHFNIAGITSMLNQFMFESDTALDGEQAFQKVKDYHSRYGKTYELILMDNNMPKVSGIEATKMIRQ